MKTSISRETPLEERKRVRNDRGSNAASSHALAHAAALVAIILAGSLSVFWTFAVPIFQAPDEPAHFDYAMSLYSAGGLVRPGDGPTGWIVTPYVRYLMRATDFQRIAEHSSMRAPVGYGSREYFKRVDAQAPKLTPKLRQHEVSYISALYPFLFYALEAGVIEIVSSASHSLTAAFFSTRIVCVVLMMIGLYFGFKTLRNVGIPPWVSAAITAAAGFFPLTTLVSSYVQPDNLVFALASLALWIATQGSNLRIPRLVLLGFVLGLLALTKYQFFLSIATPILVLLVAQEVQVGANKARVIGIIFLTIIPSLILLSFQHWLTSHSAVQPVATIAAPLQQAAALGAKSIVEYVALSASRAFIDYYVTGGSVATYWGVLGWVDTPLVIVSDGAELAIRVLVALVGVVAVGSVILLFTRSAWRLARLARRGLLRTALLLGAQDPMLNAYVCFTVIMFIVYIASNNAFGAEGRHWYPYVLASFACLAWYAPKGLRLSRLASATVISICLLAYSIVASAFATHDVLARYYGPEEHGYVVREPRAVSNQRSLVVGTLWEPSQTSYAVSQGSPQRSFPIGSPLKVQGAAILPALGGPAAAIAVVLDGSRPLPTMTHQYNYFVAEAARSVSDGYGGFEALIATSQLAEGWHKVEAYALLPNQSGIPITPARSFYLYRVAHRAAHR